MFHSAPSLRKARVWIGVMWLCLSAPSSTASGSDAVEPVSARSLLQVAVREVPPFAMRDNAGNWEGLSVDLWQDVADKLNLNFEWRELGLADTLRQVAGGELDVAVAALSVTGERERTLDFSHPYYVSGLAAAYAEGGDNAWRATLAAFFSWEFFSAVGSLAVVLLIAGVGIWWFERRENAEQFGAGDIRRGIGAGFWWSAVTMTTVGYGDKAPRTLGGRVVALIWMFVSLIIVASFTASIAASLTTNELTGNLLRERPLGELRVGVLEGSAGESYARNRGARVTAYASITDALTALGAGDLDTVVHDAPVLRHQIRERDLTAVVDDRVLLRDDYAFAFPEGSHLRNDINLALLSILLEPAWAHIRGRYLVGHAAN